MTHHNDPSFHNQTYGEQQTGTLGGVGQVHADAAGWRSSSRSRPDDHRAPHAPRPRSRARDAKATPRRIYRHDL